MAGGRPRKLTAVKTGKIGKTETANRARQEQQLKLDRNMLFPPKWLNAEAQKEFIRVVEETEKIDILDDLDLTTLAIYANAYSQYIKATEVVLKEGFTSKRITAQGEYEVISPYVVAQEKYVKQIMSCSTKLGLATTDRLKLIIPGASNDKPENKYLRLIK